MMSKPHTTRVYKSSNGYEGILYGKSSFSVFDSDGNEILHTGARSFNTYSELVDTIERMPEILDLLNGKFDEIYENAEDEGDEI